MSIEKLSDTVRDRLIIEANKRVSGHLASVAALAPHIDDKVAILLAGAISALACATTAVAQATGTSRDVAFVGVMNVIRQKVQALTPEQINGDAEAAR